MHIISTNENQVFAAVQEWNQNDTYNLYISDTRGIYFTLAMENIKSSRGLMGNIIIELYEVCSQDFMSFNSMNTSIGVRWSWIQISAVHLAVVTLGKGLTFSIASPVKWG